MTYFYYGMRLRGFSLGCQPMNGLVRCLGEKSRTIFDVVLPHGDNYFDILEYDRELTERELKDYELDYLGKFHLDLGK